MDREALLAQHGPSIADEPAQDMRDLTSTAEAYDSLVCAEFDDNVPLEQQRIATQRAR